MIRAASSTTLRVGGLAFLAGVLATLVTAYAVVSRRQSKPALVRDSYEGWEEGLGV